MYSRGDEPAPGFRLIQVLGRGGFGEVWKATAPGGTEVAIKIINLGNRQGFKEFRAVRLVRQIRHPHLVPIIAFWLKDEKGNLLDDLSNADSILARSQGSELIIAMGLGDQNLLDRLKECQNAGKPGIPKDELIDYLEAAAKAIDHLNQATHDLGSGPVAIQHCDIKPQNILLVGGSAQVCDFGLARVLEDTHVSAAAGSLAYMAPELFTENKPSKSSDQYSLAISYVQLRTGALPLDATAPGSTIWAHVEGKLDFSKLPPEEQPILKRATTIEPNGRYATSVEMVRELRHAHGSGRGAGTTTRPPGAKVVQAGSEIVPGYTLQHLIGKGSYGEVWQASAPGGKPVALKIIKNLANTQGRQEYNALELIKGVDHNHLLELHAYWLLDAEGNVIPDSQRGRADSPAANILVMASKLASKNLFQRLQECQQIGHQGIPLPELLLYMRQAAQAIDHLNSPRHSLGGQKVSIQHRDIKPENILLAADTVKVGDFSLAKVLEGSSALVNEDTGGLTLGYAPPELLKGTVSSRTDQYSLAITYFKLRTGQLPFPPGIAPYEMIQAHVDGKLDIAVLEAPERVVVARATRVKPDERYPCCLDMVRALEDACAPSQTETVAPGSDYLLPVKEPTGRGPKERKKPIDQPPTRVPASTSPQAPPEQGPAVPKPPTLRPPAALPVAEPVPPPSRPSGRKSDPPVAKPYSPPPASPGKGSAPKMPALRPDSGSKPKPVAIAPQPADDGGTLITDRVPEGLVRTKVEKPPQPPPTEWGDELLVPEPSDQAPEARRTLTPRLGPSGWQVRAARLWRKYRRVGIGIVVLLLLGVLFAGIRQWQTGRLHADVQAALDQKDFEKAFQLVEGAGFLTKTDGLTERITSQGLEHNARLLDDKKYEEALALAETFLKRDEANAAARDYRNRAYKVVLPAKIDQLVERTPPDFKQAAELLRKDGDLLSGDDREAARAKVLAPWRNAARVHFQKAEIDDGLRICVEIISEFKEDAEAEQLRSKYEPLTRKAIENQVALGTASLLEGGEKTLRAKEYFDTAASRLNELPAEKHPELRKQVRFGLVRLAARQKDWTQVKQELLTLGPQSDEERACVLALAVLAEDAAKNLQDRRVLALLKDLREPQDLREQLKKPALAWENEQLQQLLNGLADRTKNLPPDKGLDLAGEILAFAPDHVGALVAKAEKEIALRKLNDAEETLKRAQEAGGAENTKVAAAYALWKEAKGIADYSSQIERAHAALEKSDFSDGRRAIETLEKASIPDTDARALQQRRALKARLKALDPKKPEERGEAFRDLVELLKLESPPFQAHLGVALTKLATDEPSNLDAAIKALEDTRIRDAETQKAINASLASLNKARQNREFTNRIANVRALQEKKDIAAALKEWKLAKDVAPSDRETDLELKALKARLLGEKPNRSAEETSEALQTLRTLLADPMLPAGINKLDLCRGVADLAETMLERGEALTSLETAPPEGFGFYLYVSALDKEKASKVAAAVDLFKCFGTEPKLPLVFQETRRQQHAALIFQEAAAEIRAKGTLKNPFETEANAEKVHGWLQKCQELFAKENTTLDLRANLALASYSRAGADAVAARKLVLDVLQVPEAMELGGTTTALLLVKAKTEESTPQGHAAALKDFREILDRIQQAAAEEVTPVDLYQAVIDPAIKRGKELLAIDSGEEVKKQAAFFHARKGRLLVMNRDEPWDEFNKKPIDEAIRAYDEAIALEPSNARYLVGKASAGILLEKPDLKELTGIAERAAGTDRNYVSARRLLGDLYLRQSRKARNFDDRVSLLDKAQEQTEEALKLCKDADPERERPTLLLNRSMIYLELANFRQSKAETYLDQAKDDADAAALANRQYPWYAYEAQGNALEDMGMILHQKGKYTEALEAFDKAAKKRPDRPVAFVSLGRCQYRAVSAGEQPTASLKQAEDDLKTAAAKDGPHTAEAHYWQGMIHLYRAHTDGAGRTRHRANARDSFGKSIKAAKDHDVPDWMAFALAEQTSLYLDDARGQWARNPEAAGRALDMARSLANQLKDANPLLAASRLAETNIIEGKLKEALEEYTRVIPPDAAKWNLSHVEILLNRILLLTRDDLPRSVRGDRTFASLVDEADQVLSLAAGSDLEPFALGTAGAARFSAAFERNVDPGQKRTYLDSSLKQLRKAIEQARKDHPEGWRWRMCLALEIRGHFLPEAAAAQKPSWRSEALRHLNDAIAGPVPDEAIREVLQGIKKDLESPN